MRANDGTTRRRFLEGSARPGAGHVASSLLSARSFAGVVGANDWLRSGRPAGVVTAIAADGPEGGGAP